jgi:hypothetical protein
MPMTNQKKMQKYKKIKYLTKKEKNIVKSEKNFYTKTTFCRVVGKGRITGNGERGICGERTAAERNRTAGGAPAAHDHGRTLPRI